MSTDAFYYALLVWAFCLLLLIVSLGYEVISRLPKAWAWVCAWWKRRQKPMVVSGSWLREHQVSEAEQRFRTIR